MIRFKTIEPESAAKPAKAPAAAAPAVPPREQDQPAEGDAPSADQPAATKPKGARKAPLRAKKPEGARLFEG